MPMPQTTFPYKQPRAQAGQLEGPGRDDGELRAHVEAGIRFGYPTKFSVSGGNVVGVEEGVDKAGGNNTIANFAGIASKRPQFREGRYTQNELVGRRTDGEIWVRVSHAVKYRDDVCINISGADPATQFQFNSEAVSATNLPLAGARFMTSAAAGGLAKIRLVWAPSV